MVIIGGGDLAWGFFQGFLHGLWDHLPGTWTYIAFAAPAVIISLAVTTRLLLSPSPALQPARAVVA